MAPVVAPKHAIIELSDSVVGSRAWFQFLKPIYAAIADQRVAALDAKTDDLLKTFGKDGIGKVGPVEENRSITVAPLYYQGRLYITMEGSSRHIRGGLVLALDAKTGEEIWRFQTIPQGPASSRAAVEVHTLFGSGKAGESVGNNIILYGAVMATILRELLTLSIERRALGILVLLVFLPMGCYKSANRNQRSASAGTSQAPSGGSHNLIQPGDDLTQVVSRLGAPDQRGRREGGETLLYFGKGMQVNCEMAKSSS